MSVNPDPKEHKKEEPPQKRPDRIGDSGLSIGGGDGNISDEFADILKAAKLKDDDDVDPGVRDAESEEGPSDDFSSITRRIRKAQDDDGTTDDRFEKGDSGYPKDPEEPNPPKPA